MRKRSLGVNYLLNVSYQVLTIILPVITTPYIARVLGVDGVGTYNYVYTFAHITSIIAALGTNKYATREVAYQQNDKEKNARLLSEILALRSICVGIVLIFYFTGLLIIRKHQLIYLIMSLDVISVLVDISWFFQGLEEFKITVFRNFTIKITSISLMFLLVKNPTDVWKYTLIMSGGMLIGQLVMWPYLPRFTNRISFKNIRPWKHFFPSFVLFIPTISIQIYTYLDKILIGLICSEVEVGYYSQSEKIVKLVLTIISSFGTVLMPRMAILIKNKDMEQVYYNIKNSFSLVCLLGFPMVFGLLVVSSRFVPWFLGDGYEPCITILRVLAPLILIMGIASITGASILIPLGRQNLYNLSIISGTIINLIFNLLLIPRYGAIGASIATILAESTVTGLELFFLRDHLAFKDIIMDNWHYLIVSIMMVVPYLFLNNIIPIGAIGILQMAVFGCLIYTVILLLIRDKFLLYMVAKLPKWR